MRLNDHGMEITMRGHVLGELDLEASGPFCGLHHPILQLNTPVFCTQDQCSARRRRHLDGGHFTHLIAVLVQDELHHFSRFGLCGSSARPPAIGPIEGDHP